MKIRSLVLVAAMAMVAPSSLNAQVVSASAAGSGMHDCGQNCIYCGYGYWEGQDHNNVNGIFDMTCGWSTVGCRLEGCGSGSADDDLISADLIADAVVHAEEADVKDVVLAYGDRLLLSSERGLVAIKGTNCAPDELARLVFVSPAKIAQLDRFGIQQMDAYFAEQAQGQSTPSDL